MLSKEVSPLDFRDPRLFKKDDWYYFIAGARVLALEASKEELDERTRKWDRHAPSSSLRYVEADAVHHTGVSNKGQSPSLDDVFGIEPVDSGFGNLILCRSRDLMKWEYVGHLLHRQPEFEEDFYNLNGV